MFCPGCSSIIPETSEVCPVCGTPVGEGAPPPSPEALDVEPVPAVTVSTGDATPPEAPKAREPSPPRRAPPPAEPPQRGARYWGSVAALVVLAAVVSAGTLLYLAPSDDDGDEGPSGGLSILANVTVELEGPPGSMNLTVTLWVRSTLVGVIDLSFYEVEATLLVNGTSVRQVVIPLEGALGYQEVTSSEIVMETVDMSPGDNLQVDLVLRDEATGTPEDEHTWTGTAS